MQGAEIIMQIAVRSRYAKGNKHPNPLLFSLCARNNSWISDRDTDSIQCGAGVESVAFHQKYKSTILGAGAMQM